MAIADEKREIREIRDSVPKLLLAYGSLYQERRELSDITWRHSNRSRLYAAAWTRIQTIDELREYIEKQLTAKHSIT